MRWLILKDLRILRRSPLLVALLVLADGEALFAGSPADLEALVGGDPRDFEAAFVRFLHERGH